jgi:pimeloyl-ACP methyl ester carboxylesterase
MPYIDLSPHLKLFYKVDDWTDAWVRPETILLVHGFTETTEAWHGWIPHLARRYRVISIDLRGFGRSGPVAKDFVYTNESWVDAPCARHQSGRRRTGACHRSQERWNQFGYASRLAA